jgi:hypothetical protein
MTSSEVLEAPPAVTLTPAERKRQDRRNSAKTYEETSRAEKHNDRDVARALADRILAWKRQRDQKLAAVHREHSEPLNETLVAAAVRLRRRATGGEVRPREHHHRARRAHGPPGGSSDDPDPGPPLKRACRGCGSDFEARDPRRQYCNIQCSRRAAMARYRGRLRLVDHHEEKFCPSCGDWTQRLVERTGWCRDCTRDFARAAA